MQTADWSILDDTEVVKVAERAVRRVFQELPMEYEPAVTQDDLLQDAQVILATRLASTNWRHAHRPYRVLEARLMDDLRDVMKTPLRRGVLNGSIDAIEERKAGESYNPVGTASDPRESGAYDRQLVELLMPAVWDEQCAYGMERPEAPDKDMPRAKPDPKRSNTLWAHLADIRIAWKCAPLTFKQRRALLMRFGLDWEPKRAAAHEGIRRQVFERRVEAAVGIIVNHLNGTTLHEAAVDIMAEV